MQVESGGILWLWVHYFYKTISAGREFLCMFAKRKISSMKNLALFICGVLFFTGAAGARTVTGEVVCGSKGVSKVIVTDGESFTTTTVDGQFSFDIKDSAEYVYIITPSGYVADWSKGAPEFYQKVKDNEFFSFQLTKIEGGDKEYNIIAGKT